MLEICILSCTGLHGWKHCFGILFGNHFGADGIWESFSWKFHFSYRENGFGICFTIFSGRGVIQRVQKKAEGKILKIYTEMPRNSLKIPLKTLKILWISWLSVVFPHSLCGYALCTLPKQGQLAQKVRHGHSCRKWCRRENAVHMFGDFWGDSTPPWELQCLSAMVRPRHTIATSPSVLMVDQNLRNNCVTAQWRRPGCRVSPCRHTGWHSNIVPPG